jgi:hypothetical protein
VKYNNEGSARRRGVKEEKENVVCIRLTNRDKEKLDYLTETLDRSPSWIFNRLFSEATVEYLQVLCGSGGRRE